MIFGQSFPTWDDFRMELNDWAICIQFSFRVVCNDKLQAQYEYQHKESGSLWRLYASYNDDGEIKVKRVHA